LQQSSRGREYLVDYKRSKIIYLVTRDHKLHRRNPILIVPVPFFRMSRFCPFSVQFLCGLCGFLLKFVEYVEFQTIFDIAEPVRFL